MNLTIRVYESTNIKNVKSLSLPLPVKFYSEEDGGGEMELEDVISEEMGTSNWRLESAKNNPLPSVFSMGLEYYEVIEWLDTLAKQVENIKSRKEFTAFSNWAEKNHALYNLCDLYEKFTEEQKYAKSSVKATDILGIISKLETKVRDMPHGSERKACQAQIDSFRKAMKEILDK